MSKADVPCVHDGTKCYELKKEEAIRENDVVSVFLL